MVNSTSNSEIAISVVVPCYNESEVLPHFIDRMVKTCKLTKQKCEIIIIDDGSKDSTWPIIVENSLSNKDIIGIKLSRNHGHQLALTAGLNYAKGDKILIIDADLQDPPELLMSMLELMAPDVDVVYGLRNNRLGESYFKKISAFFFYRILEYLSETRIPRDTGDFRLISRKALKVFLCMDEYHRFIRGMISWVGFKQVPLSYEREARKAGISKYPFAKMWIFALNAVTSFSIKPLRIASYIGFSLAIISLLVMCNIIMSYFKNHTAVQGWSSLIVIILLIGSLQLIVLGLIGEYLGRMYIESKKRPLYIIDKTTQ